MPLPRAFEAIPILVTSPRASAWPQPVTVGVPFPRGALTDPTTLTLTDPDGKPVLLQTEVLARWADGSVKWLLLDFVLPPRPEAEVIWRLESVSNNPPLATALAVQELPPALFVETGAASFRFGCRKKGTLNVIASTPRSGKYLGAIVVAHVTDAAGRCHTWRSESEAIESQGPVRATIYSAGPVHGWGAGRFAARFCFFAGMGLVRVRFALHNPARARHPGGCWDLGDRGSLFFQGSEVLIWTLGDSPGEKRWQGGPNEGPRPFPEEAVAGKGTSRLCPVVSLRFVESESSAAGEVTAALPEFWQQFPKRLRAAAAANSLCLELFPTGGETPYELQGGEQKTHTVWLHFGPPDDAPELPLAWVHESARVRVAPAWVAACGVLPFFDLSLRDNSTPLDTLLHGIIDGPHSWFAKREIIDEYGWRNFGEVYADHENAYFDGPKPIISHYNNQYDGLYGLIFQYLRTGDPRWFDLLDPLARHVIDIDIYHTKEDKAAYNGGLFWHTDHYKTAHTATHRAYSRHNKPKDGRPYGGGPGNEHNYTTGLLHYYCLTGNPDARDAVLSLADWVVAMDDGRLTIFRLLDDGPTGLASATYEPSYHGPGRGAGNSVNALLDGWLLTTNRAYLDKAEALIRRVVHPADDVAARDLLNVEARWSYTVFLSVLDRYLSLKAEAGEIDEPYAYARASLLHYAAWMVNNERPYFDRPKELQYPTETWALQELRKANVMRLAARYADEPLRSKLLERGGTFARRAWADFLGFSSQHVTRAQTLLMREGPVDAWLRTRPVTPAPVPQGEYDFGSPHVFVPQKQRVKAMLKSPAGLLRAALCLLDLRRWKRP